MPDDVSDRRRLRGGPHGCAPRRRPPRPAAPPRRSTPRVPTAAAGGGCRHHRPAPRPGRRAGPSPRPARRPTHRSAEPGRRLGEPRRPSAGARAPRRGRLAPSGVPRPAGRVSVPAPRTVAALPTWSPSPRGGPAEPASSPPRRARAPPGASSRRWRRRAGAAGPADPPPRDPPPSPPGRSRRRARRAASSPPIAGPAVPRPAVRIPCRAPSGRPACSRPPTPPPRLGLRPSRPGRSTGPPLPSPAAWRLAGTASTTPPVVGAAVAATGAGRCHVDQAYLCPDEHQREAIREEGRPGGRPSSSEIRRRPTLPGSLPPSTIGAGGLNFRVRNGNGCDPAAMATEICCQLGERRTRRSPPEDSIASTNIIVNPSPRPISTGRLNTLPCLHLRPINVVVFHGPYLVDPVGNLILERASRLDAFSAYPFRRSLTSRALGRTTGTRELRPSRSSRTRDSLPQVPYGCRG